MSLEFFFDDREKKILIALWRTGGIAHGVTVEEIAARTKFNVHGISQTLLRLPNAVEFLGGRGRDRVFKLKKWPLWR